MKPPARRDHEKTENRHAPTMADETWQSKHFHNPAANTEDASGTNKSIEEARFRPPQYPAEHRPLINYCTNEWKSHPPQRPEPAKLSLADRFEDCMDSYFDCCIAMLKSRKFQRLFITTTAILIFGLTLWFAWLGPQITESKAIAASLKKDVLGGRFGVNVRPQFPGTTQLLTLDTELLPNESSQKHRESGFKRRLIFIGDIHGCKKDLQNLLQKVEFDPSTDHIITTGDMIAKGPDSLGVIDLLQTYKASCVRGNHEDRILLLAAQLKSPLRNKYDQTTLDSEKIGIDGESLSHADLKDRILAHAISADQLKYKYLRSCPVILEVGALKQFGAQIVVAHAGLVPGVPLDRQDPSSAMMMRSIDLSSHVPSRDYDLKGSLPWIKLWGHYQQLLPVPQWVLAASGDSKQESAVEVRTTVIYGHDSKRGLQIKKYTRGLDTGCVTGGKLTALVVTDGGKEHIVQVKCKDYLD